MKNNFNEYWSKQLTSEEKDNLEPMRLNNKDILTDFDFLHYDNYVEDEDLCGDSVQIAFYDNNCLWQIKYIFNDEKFTLRCVYKPNKDAFRTSYQSIRSKICGCTNENEFTPIVHIITSEENKLIEVTHYFPNV